MLGVFNHSCDSLTTTSNMKFFAAFVLAAAMTAGHCVPVKNVSPTPQQIKELTGAIILFAQSLLPKVNHMPLAGFVNQHVTVSDIDTDVIASLRNGVAYGVNEISFDQYEFDPSTSSTKIRLTSPNHTEVFDYQVDGKILGLNVTGEGVVRNEITGFGYIVTDLRFEEIDHSLQISVLELRFVLDNVRINVEGLNVDKITVQQLEKLLEIYVVAKNSESSVELSKGFAAEMKKNFNQMMSGRSTDAVIQWLKEHSNEEVHKDFIQNFVTSFVKVL